MALATRPDSSPYNPEDVMVHIILSEYHRSPVRCTSGPKSTATTLYEQGKEKATDIHLATMRGDHWQEVKRDKCPVTSGSNYLHWLIG